MITILVGILSLFGLYTNVLAETAPKTFKTKDPVILTDYIEGAPKVHYKEIDGGILVYCQNEALVYQGKYTMKLYSQIDDGFIYILENKPNTGDKSKDYYAMQIAIWWYEDILNNNNVNIPRNVKINILNKVNTLDIYIQRVKQGFKSVMETNGTGVGYINSKYKPAGKTGTSQSIIDTNNDGYVDTMVLNHTFVSYAPYDDPKVTFTVISPNIFNYKGKSNSRNYVNMKISRAISKKFFEIYK